MAGPYAEYCRKLLQPLTKNLCQYRENGVELVAVIGINTSPSCSVEDPESIMMKILLDTLKEIGYSDFRCIDASSSRTGSCVKPRSTRPCTSQSWI